MSERYKQLLVGKWRSNPIAFIASILGGVLCLYALVILLLLGVMFAVGHYKNLNWVDDTLSIQYLPPPVVKRDARFCKNVVVATVCRNATIRFSLTGVCVENIHNLPTWLDKILIKKFGASRCS